MERHKQSMEQYKRSMEQHKRCLTPKNSISI